MGKKKGKGKSQEGAAAPPTQEQPSGSGEPEQPSGSRQPEQPTQQEQHVPAAKQEEAPKPGGGKKKKWNKLTVGAIPDQPPQPQQVPPTEKPTPKHKRGAPPQQQMTPPPQQQMAPPPQQQIAPPPQQQMAPPPQQQQMAPPPQQQQMAPSPQKQKAAKGPRPKTQQVEHPPQQVGYPPQQVGYPPQQQVGYPPQQVGYPSQQVGYPPQQVGYPPQQQVGYPPQQVGYPPQQVGYPAQQVGYPPQPQISPTHQQMGPPQQRGPAPQQQRGPAPQQQRGPAPQQQRGPAPEQQKGPWTQEQRGPAPQQQRGPGPQQQRGPAAQQAGPAPQQQMGPMTQQPVEPQPGSSGDPKARKQPQKASPPKGGTPTKQIAKLQISDEYQPLKYIDVKPGKEGRPIKIETNHLALMLGNLQVAYHYDVNLVPDTPKKYLRPVMEMFRQQMYPKRYPAFDGRKNLYSSTPLPKDPISATVVYKEPDGRDKEYKVEVKFANEVDMRGLMNKGFCKETPREAMQVVDIVLRSAPALTLTPVGRSFFHKPAQIIELGEGMEMYHGFYQSAVRGWKPFLNVDVAHKAFPKNINVIDALLDLFASDYRGALRREDLARGLDRMQLEKFEKFIKTLKITYEIPNIAATRRSYRVNGLGEAAAVKKFRPNDGPEVTIEQYFSEKYRTRLRYTRVPTLWVGNRERADRMLLPLEFCTIEANQAVNRKMTENQTSAMIKHAATNTAVRKDKIMRALDQARHNQNPTVREFGFSVANEFEKLEARVLRPPTLGYFDGRTVNVARGVWRGEKFVTGATINNWTIACADRAPRGDELGNLANMITRHSRDCGMIFANPAVKPYDIIGNRQNDIKAFFQKIKGRYDIVFVVVGNSGPTYSYVKSAAEINTGCLTQCLKMNTLNRKMNPQTVMNILLKVNAKLNGLNHILHIRPPILSRPCMIMGADVTHPSPDSQNIPSVAAVTASHEPKAFKYNICWRLQPPRVEIIEDLQAIVEEQLLFFYRNNKQMKPERIVFFRDGVSEGQFEQVIHSEIRAIRAACKKLQQDGYEPKITFLVVQKRHHTRLFPLNPRDSEDKNFNVPAGTCVDKDITHPFLQDFYLVSHASIQGVAKPTKYCTLWDDNDMSNDEIEALAYHLCHLFTRCTRSVSYPAPTYYAHLAAARAKVYIENENLDMNRLTRERERFLIQDVIRRDLPMFFV